MAGNKKPRKKFNAARYEAQRIQKMVKQVHAMPLTSAAQRDIEIAAHIALERLIQGGDEASLYVLLQSLDISRGLALQGVGGEFRQEIERGMASLVRMKKSGSWQLQGDDAKAVSNALAIHDAQMEVAASGLVIKTINEMNARIQEGLKTDFEEQMLEAA